MRSLSVHACTSKPVARFIDRLSVGVYEKKKKAILALYHQAELVTEDTTLHAQLFNNNNFLI